MLRSMTGYGRREVTGALHVTIEIRSVNNRFIDIQVKGPRSLAVLEPRIKKTVQDRCSRGRFDIFITRTGERESAGRVVVDERLLGQYIGVMRNMKQRYGLSGELDLSLVASFSDIISIEEDKEDAETVWPPIAEGLAGALEDLDAMRAVEGKTLATDISARIRRIEDLTNSIRELSPASVELARKRMSETLNRILNEQPDPVRVAQEIAILAERTDVTEELTRLGSHIGQFSALLSEPGTDGIGRKLDFLLQEMGREANTIASKAMNADIAHHVVDMKAELEKIREQVQNIE